MDNDEDPNGGNQEQAMMSMCPQCGRELHLEIRSIDGRWRDLVGVIAERTGVTIGELEGPDRRRRLVDVRRLVARIMRVRGATLRDVGEVLGNRDHTTVMNLMKKPVPGYLEDLLIDIGLFHVTKDEPRGHVVVAELPAREEVEAPSQQVVGRSTIDGEHLHLLAPGRVPPFQGRCGVPLEIHTLDYPTPGTHGKHLCDRCVQTLVPPTWPPAEDCA